MSTASVFAHPGVPYPPGVAVGEMTSPTRAPLNAARIAKDAALTLALVLLNLGGIPGSSIFFAILTVMVFWKPSAAYKAVLISALGLILNEAFVPKTVVWTVARLVLPMLACARFLIDLAATRGGGAGGMKGTYATLMVYVFTMAACSFASGWYTHIALLKLFNFWILMTMVFAGTAVLRRTKVDLSEWVVSQIVATAVVGVAAVATGQSRNFLVYRLRDTDIAISDSLFNGAFLHPNAHAAYASLFVIFLVSIYLFSHYRQRLLTLPLIATWLIFMVYSQSRTSLFATAVPLLVVLPFEARKVVRDGRLFKPHVSRATLAAAAMVMACGLLILDVAADRVVTKQAVMFLHKWDQTETTELSTETMLSSRQGKIDESMANFRENPWHGIGFGVAKNDFFVQGATLFTAPAEKGFLISAVLEEGGIFGAAAFVLFLLTMVVSLVRSHNVPALLTLACMIVSNFGEVTLFAPGGSGTFLWMMFGLAVILGDHCWQKPLPPRTASAPGGMRAAIAPNMAA